MTAVATVIFIITKFSAGAWVVVIAIPALILLFTRVDAYYRDVATEIGLGTFPPKPAAGPSVVVVAVTAVSQMTAAALATGLSLDEKVIAVSVQFDDERAGTLRADWEHWAPGVALTVLRPPTRSVTKPMLDYLDDLQASYPCQLLVLIPEVEPKKWRHQLLQNQRGIILANALRRHSDVNVTRVPFPLSRE